MISLDWQKIRTELAKIKDMQTLKEELHKLSTEIKKIDLDSNLVPQARKQLASLQNRYETFVVQLSSAQKQLDREFNRVWRQMRQTKVQAQSTLKMAKKDVLKHGTSLDKMAKSLAKTIASSAKASTQSSSKKRSSQTSKTRKSTVRNAKTSKRKTTNAQ